MPSLCYAENSDRYKSLETSQFLSKEQFQILLQSFVNEKYLKAFKYLADERDFNHGHLIITDTKNPSERRLLGILWHTQEGASDAAVGDKYDYIDKMGRNWIEWIADPQRIDNAFMYKGTKPAPGAHLWTLWESAEGAYTIHTEMLNLGVPILTSGYQVFFREIPCPAAEFPKSSNKIKIQMPSGTTTCLALF